MKKFILLFLTCIMVMSGTVMSFAEEGGETENTVSFEIQIEGIDGTVLFEKVDLQLGEETVYLADVLKMIDEENDDLEKTCTALIDKANENGGGDNITTVLIKLDTQPSEPKTEDSAE